MCKCCFAIATAGVWRSSPFQDELIKKSALKGSHILIINMTMTNKQIPYFICI